MALIETYVDPDATGENNGTSWEDAYTSLNLWDSEEQTDLVTDGDSHLVHCRSSSGTADTTEVSVAGWTTDATHTITIQVDQADRHDGKWNANKFRLVVTNPAYGALTINEDYVSVIGLQIHVPSVTGDSKYCLEATGQTSSNQVNIKNCILRGPGSGSDTYSFRCLQFYDADTKTLVRNCLVYDSGSDSYSYGIMTGSAGVAEIVIQNCTSAYHWRCFSVDSDSVTVTLTNCLGTDCLGDTNKRCFIIGGTTINQNYCCSSDDTANDNGGTGNRENQTVTYVDKDNDDFHLASNDAGAKDYGTSLSGQFTDDIDGETRTGTWDIGCDEYLAGETIVTPDPLNLELTLQSPTVVIDCTVLPSALELALSLQDPSIAIDCTILPSVLQLALALETPALTFDYVVFPSTLQLALTLQDSTVSCSITVLPDTLALALALQEPEVSAAVVVTPDTLALGLTLEAPTLMFDCTILPSALELALSLQTPIILPTVIITPDTLLLGLTLQSPVILPTSIITPDVLSLIATLLAPTIDTGEAMVGPNSLALGVSILTPAVYSQYVDIPPFMQKDIIDIYSGGAWLWLCEIAVPGYSTQRFARNTENVNYAGEEYQKFNLDLGKQEFIADGSIPRIVLRVAQDADRTLEDIVNESKGAVGGAVKLIRVNEKFLDVRVNALEIDYDLLSAESDPEWVTFTLGLPNPLTQPMPLRVDSAKMCPYAVPGLFKGPECQYTGGDTSCKGTLEDCRTKGNAVHWGGEIGLDPNTIRV